MAFIEVIWTKTKSINIREYASCFVFNKPTIDLSSLSTNRRNWIEKEIVSCILEDLDETWEQDQWETPLFKVNKGVYVITLSGNICIQYPNKESQVVYIARGKIRSRIKIHLTNWVTHFSESLHDIKFQIWMTQIKIPGAPNAFKDVEADLIEIFEEEYGDIPIQNSKGGNYHNKDHNYNAEWKSPLKVDPSINSGWCIKPMPDNEWFAEMEE
jgi:hypothetical protein